MAEIIRFARTPHDETQLLLPWYVNGTLDRDETEFVDAHLAECADCRRDVDSERSLFREIATSSFEVERDRAAADGGPERAPPRTGASAFLRRRVSMGWVLAGQLATAAALALAIYAPFQSAKPDATYEALGSSSERPTGNVVIVFDAARSEGDMRAVLLQVDARIVDGPNASGAYVLSVPPAERREALDRLRRLPQVVLAEPIDGG